MIAKILLRRSLANPTLAHSRRLLSTSSPALLQKTPDFFSPSSAKDTESQGEQNKKQNIANEFIETVLYGSKKIKEEESQTHSKMLARGKYVHELQSKRVLFF